MKKRNRKKMFWFKNEFQKRGLKSGLTKEIRKLLNLVEITSLKKKVRNLEMSERNQKRKSEKKVRNLEMSIKKSEKQV